MGKNDLFLDRANFRSLPSVYPTDSYLQFHDKSSSRISSYRIFFCLQIFVFQFFVSHFFVSKNLCLRMSPQIFVSANLRLRISWYRISSSTQIFVLVNPSGNLRPQIFVRKSSYRKSSSTQIFIFWSANLLR